MTPFMQLKEGLRKTILNCIVELYPNEASIDFQIERSKAEGYGDFSTTVAFSLCKSLRKPPMEIASILTNRLKGDMHNAELMIVAPGFINIYLSKNWKTDLLKEYASEKQSYPIQMDNQNLEENLKDSITYMLFRCQWILQVFAGEGVRPNADNFNYITLSNDLEKKLIDELVNLMESMGESGPSRIQEVFKEIIRLFNDYNSQGDFRQMKEVELNSALGLFQLITHLIDRVM